MQRSSISQFYQERHGKKGNLSSNPIVITAEGIHSQREDGHDLL